MYMRPRALFREIRTFDGSLIGSPAIHSSQCLPIARHQIQRRQISNDASHPDNERGYYTPTPNQLLADRYRVVGKLGWGQFASVWVAEDLQTKTHTALKILNKLAMAELSSGIIDELNILKRVSSVNPAHPGFPHILGLTDHFRVQCSTDSEEHVCIVHEMMGPSVSDVIIRTKAPGAHLGLPLPMVKSIAKQTLMAVEYLHEECKVIHCDIKPTNLLVSVPNAEPLIREALKLSQSPFEVPISLPLPVLDDPVNLHYKLMDFGHSNWINKHCSEWIQPEALRAPEVVLGAPWDTSADIWNVGCFLFEILTGQILFQDVQNKPWTAADDTQDHILRMRYVLGEELPDELMKYYYKEAIQEERSGLVGGAAEHIASVFENARTRTTTLIPSLNTHRWAPLPYFEKMLYANALVGREYGVTEEDVKAFGKFIRKMVRVRPRDRKSAKELLRDRVLSGVA
ncbi:hypothetical protein M422DRAFT_29299 [Sphaerobolus stellatus SS14]|nr:hypothetical protein M422DRAFT_29299 [Sphaerobolus stellatus SS14]